MKIDRKCFGCRHKDSFFCKVYNDYKFFQQIEDDEDEKSSFGGFGFALEEEEEEDIINSPSHYIQGNNFEVIEVIEDWELDYIEGNIIKYIARYKHKNGKEDLEKARWYLNRLIENCG